MKENLEPTSADDMAKIEQEHLTDAQRLASERREKAFKDTESHTGVSGALVRERVETTEKGPYGKGYRHTFRGELAGHDVILTVEGNQVYHESKVSAVVDGVELPFGEAYKLHQKYLGFVEKEKYDQDMKNIAEEKEAFQLELKKFDKIKKDLDI